MSLRQHWDEQWERLEKDRIEKARETYIFLSVALSLVILFSALSLSCFRTEFAAIDLKIIEQMESSGNPSAINKKSGCIGLMQINPKGALADWNMYKTNRKYTSKDLYNPEINLEIARWYIEDRIPQMLRYFNIPDKKIDNVLIAYKCGISCAINKHKGKKLTKETVNYIKKYKKLARKEG